MHSFFSVLDDYGFTGIPLLLSLMLSEWVTWRELLRTSRILEACLIIYVCLFNKSYAMVWFFDDILIINICLWVAEGFTVEQYHRELTRIVHIQGHFPVQAWIVKANIETVVIASKEKVDRLLLDWVSWLYFLFFGYLFYNNLFVADYAIRITQESLWSI